MMKMLVTMLLVSFSTTVLTVPSPMPGPAVDSAQVLAELEAVYAEHGAGSNTFKETLQNFINAYKSLATDYEAQVGVLEGKFEIAEANGDYVLAAELEKKLHVLEATAEGYGDMYEMLQEFLDLINENEQKLGEIFDGVRRGLSRAAKREAKLQPSTPATTQPPPPPAQPEPEPPVKQPPTEPPTEQDIQTLLESLLASLG